jgi:hypothetical protein
MFCVSVHEINDIPFLDFFYSVLTDDIQVVHRTNVSHEIGLLPCRSSFDVKQFSHRAQMSEKIEALKLQ